LPMQSRPRRKSNRTHSSQHGRLRESNEPCAEQSEMIKRAKLRPNLTQPLSSTPLNGMFRLDMIGVWGSKE
jgi:hypothetical protein